MKSVAIIGAGPAGLVAAKTLLHSCPKNTFSVSVFETASTIGGLWAVEAKPNGLIHPNMRTNLDQFTVCFSDLAWDSVELESPANIYPKAWQVDRYLQLYTRKYIPDGTINFQTQVKSVNDVQNEGKSQWRVTTVGNESKIEEVKVFDYLIIGNGFFSKSKPPNFTLDGVGDAPILHSSRFRELGDLSATGKQPTKGKILVVGGNHSGTEVAATIAMQMFDSCYSPSGSKIEPLEIVNVMPCPVVALPAFVQSGKGDAPHFLPLQSLINDVSSRGEGPITFTYAHNTPEKNKARREVINKLMDGPLDEDTVDNADPDDHSPYAVVGEKYREFVRSGAISSILGKLIIKGGFMSAKVSQKSGELEIKDIAAVIYANGFTSPSLGFLPKRVLGALDYAPSYPRLPLLLSRDCLTTSNTGPKNLAIMGAFDGSYWGFLESQARVIAKKWAADDQSPISSDAEADEKLLAYMKELREIMDKDPLKIPQNFFGDYIGILEGTSEALGLRRVDLNWQPREGMVTPARYIDEGSDVAEAEKTMKKLQKLLDLSVSPRAFTATAVFRALQGTWNVKHEGAIMPDMTESPTSAVFYPRNPTHSNSNQEFLVMMCSDQESGSTVFHGKSTKLVYRLLELDNSILIWSVSEDLTTRRLLKNLEFNDATSDSKNSLSVAVYCGQGSKRSTVYSFVFVGVHISSFSIQDKLSDGEVTHTSELHFTR